MRLENLFDKGMNGGVDDTAKLGISLNPSRVASFRNIISLLGEVVNIVLASERKFDVRGLTIIVASI